MSKLQKSLEYLLGSILIMPTANYLLIDALLAPCSMTGWYAPLKTVFP